MVASAMDFFATVFRQCAEWFVVLLNSVDGGEYVIAGFIVFMCVSLFLKPMRGGSVALSDMGDNFLSGNPIHKPRRFRTYNVSRKSSIKKK